MGIPCRKRDRRPLTADLSIQTAPFKEIVVPTAITSQTMDLLLSLGTSRPIIMRNFKKFLQKTEQSNTTRAKRVVSKTMPTISNNTTQ
jgi:hypothetical protein